MDQLLKLVLQISELSKEIAELKADLDKERRERMYFQTELQEALERLDEVKQNKAYIGVIW